MHVLYQFNEKYAPYAGVSMTSLFENNKAAKFICVYILGENLSPESVKRLEETAGRYDDSSSEKRREVVFVDTARLIELMKALDMPAYRGSYAANMRLFVDYIFEGLDADKNLIPEKLLYLDADTIVTGDLTQLFETEIKTLGMVYDSLANHHKYSIGLGKEEGYYNSGVILYDVRKWIDGDFTRKIINHVKNVRAQYPSPDQDLINVVLKGEISVLPFKYNYQPHLSDYSYGTFMKCFNPYPFYGEEEVTELNKAKGSGLPVIMHAFRYLGEFPWHKGNYHPFTAEFDKYLLMSLWNDYVKEESEGGFVTKTEKVMYRILPKGFFLPIFKIIHSRFYKKADRLSQAGKISGRM